MSDAPLVMRDVRRFTNDGHFAAAARHDAAEPGIARPATVRQDTLVKEEPLEIRIEHRGHNTRLAVTMRTPGDDIALATGFLFTEGIIDDPSDLVEVRRCAEPGPDDEPVRNIVQALLRPDHPFDPAGFARHGFMSSSCGLCGKTSIDALEVACRPTAAGRPRVGAGVLHGLPAALRAAQVVFADTGGIHAAGLFTAAGEVVDVAEDVGRHNAMDKVIGRAFQANWVPLGDHVVIVSGRLSFELVQKAARAGVAVLAAIGAPSSLAVETADRFGMTLVGFLSERRFNVYTDAGRIAPE